jgi:putative redox protein
MIHKVSTSWKQDMKFDAIVNNHHLLMDANAESGGENAGPRPKELMLAALAGCTGMDVVSILRKMRVFVDGFTIDIEADLTEEHPKQYYRMHLVYRFKGKELEEAKLKKAVDLSQERYCGVSAMYRKAMNLTYEIRITE